MMSTVGDEIDRPNLTPAMAQARLEERKRAREAKKVRRHAAGEAFKEEGNALFKQGRYSDAVAKFNEATIVNGLQPVYMSNLALAYLKLEQYDLAEWSADCALLHAPLMFKARYRRAMARKGLGMYKAAEIDFKTILEQDPENQESQTGLASVQADRKKYGDGPEGSVLDLKFPPLNDYEEWEYPIDSDSEESNHIGNRTPCKLHNHGGCSKGSRCSFSHAPDNKSVRDKLGQNVCLNYLLHSCKSQDGCAYAHTKEYLGEGWWNNKKEIKDTKMLLNSSNNPDSNFDRLERLENTTIYGRQIKAQRFQRYLQHTCKLGADELNSKIIEKATSGGSSDPFVLLISLDEGVPLDKVYNHLLTAIKKKIKVVRAYNPPEASSNLSLSQLAGVLITDPGMLRASPDIMSTLVEYAKNGGSVVIAGNTASFAKSSDVNRFFEKNFQLPWRYGSYFRTTFTKNPTNDLVKANPSLPKSYSMKALHLSNVDDNSAMYQAMEGFPPTKVKDLDEAPAVSTSFGKGRISFLGDVNGETESTSTVLAMLGLLDNVPSISKSKASTTAPQSTVSVAPKKKQTAKKTPNTTPSGISLSDFNIVGQAGLGLAISSSASPLDLTSSSSSTSTQLSILFLSMGDQGSLHSKVYEEQIEAIQTKTSIVHAMNDLPLRGANLKSYPSLSCIYVTDAAISEHKNLHLTKSLVEYVNNGGRLIFGGTFASLVKANDIAPLFAKFGLKWSAGDSTRSTFALNSTKNSFAESNPFLPKEITIKALSLTNVDVKDVVYYHAGRDLGSQTQIQSPIIFKKISKGYIGYIGDANAEKCVDPSMYSMMGFMNNPSTMIQPPPTQSRKFVIALTNSTNVETYNNTPLMKELTKKSIKVLGSEHLDEVRIVELLKSPDLVGVLVLEEVFSFSPSPSSSIEGSEEKKWFESQIAAYIWAGGKVVFCDRYTTSTTHQSFTHFFADLLLLSWFFQSPQKFKVTLNKDHSLIKNVNANSNSKGKSKSAQKQKNSTSTTTSTLEGIPEIIKSYEAVYLRGLYEHDMIYRSDPNDGVGNWPIVPVACAEVGKGYVGFFGRLKMDEGDWKLVMLMLGV